MAKIVINISDDTYYRCKNERVGLLPFDVPGVCYAIANGTVLPKGHGRLSDVDWILNKMSTTDAQPITPNEHYAWDFAKALLRKAPTVIEADKEENIND